MDYTVSVALTKRATVKLLCQLQFESEPRIETRM
jgi:hypothetical protein